MYHPFRSPWLGVGLLACSTALPVGLFAGEPEALGFGSSSPPTREVVIESAVARLIQQGQYAGAARLWEMAQTEWAVADGAKSASPRTAVIDGVLAAARGDFASSARQLAPALLTNTAPESAVLENLFGGVEAYRRYLDHVRTLPVVAEQAQARWLVLARGEHLLAQMTARFDTPASSNQATSSPASSSSAALAEPIPSAELPRWPTFPPSMSRMEPLMSAPLMLDPLMSAPSMATPSLGPAPSDLQRNTLQRLDDLRARSLPNR